jgi:hypothetical protein
VNVANHCDNQLYEQRARRLEGNRDQFKNEGSLIARGTCGGAEMITSCRVLSVHLVGHSVTVYMYHEMIAVIQMENEQDLCFVV